MKLLIITRGISGSGKTTLANKLKKQILNGMPHRRVEILSTDDYWMEDGEYKFDITKLGKAHQWNLARCYYEISKQTDCIIIDNTNIVWKDFKKYIKVATEHNYDIMLAEPQTDWKHNIIECDQKNTHNVPRETIEKMHHKYQNNNVIIGFVREMMEQIETKVNIFEYDQFIKELLEIQDNILRDKTRAII